MRLRFTAEDRRLVEPSEEQIRNVPARTNNFRQRMNSTAAHADIPPAGPGGCRRQRPCRRSDVPALSIEQANESATNPCAERPARNPPTAGVHQTSASLRQLAAGIAHELNNPLGTILLYSGLRTETRKRRFLSNDIGLIQRTQRCKRIVAGLELRPSELHAFLPVPIE